MMKNEASILRQELKKLVIYGVAFVAWLFSWVYFARWVGVWGMLILPGCAVVYAVVAELVSRKMARKRPVIASETDIGQS